MSSIYFQHEVRKYLQEMRGKVEAVKMNNEDQKFFEDAFSKINSLLEKADRLEKTNERLYREALNQALVIRLKAFLKLDDLIADQAKKNHSNL